MLIVSVFYNIGIIHMIVYFFKVLLFTAQFDNAFMQCCIEIVRNLPIVIPLNLFWINGYHLRNCVASFDNFTVSILSINGVKIPAPPGCRVKLFLIFLVLVVVHTLHFIVQYYDANADGIETLSIQSSGGFIWSVVFEYSTAILLTLIIPTYCTFCWAVDYELNLFFEYVNVLICRKVAPKYEHFDEFKRCYRKIADDIMFINQLFAIYLSVIIVIIGQVVYGEAQNLGLRVLSIIMKAFSEDEETTVQALTILELRILVGETVIILLYVALFGFTIWQAVVVNDNVRYLHVWINDFVTEPVSRLPTHLYEGFTLLKWYIHSRLEQERPALLNIMAVSLIPFLATRLRQYRVRH